MAQGTVDSSGHRLCTAVVDKACLSHKGSPVGLSAEGCLGAAGPAGQQGGPYPGSGKIACGSKVSSGELFERKRDGDASVCVYARIICVCVSVCLCVNVCVRVDYAWCVYLCTTHGSLAIRLQADDSLRNGENWLHPN